MKIPDTMFHASRNHRERLLLLQGCICCCTIFISIYPIVNHFMYIVYIFCRCSSWRNEHGVLSCSNPGYPAGSKRILSKQHFSV